MPRVVDMLRPAAWLSTGPLPVAPLPVLLLLLPATPALLVKDSKLRACCSGPPAACNRHKLRVSGAEAAAGLEIQSRVGIYCCCNSTPSLTASHLLEEDNAAEPVGKAIAP